MKSPGAQILSCLNCLFGACYSLVNETTNAQSILRWSVACCHARSATQNRNIRTSQTLPWHPLTLKEGWGLNFSTTKWDFKGSSVFFFFLQQQRVECLRGLQCQFSVQPWKTGRYNRLKNLSLFIQCQNFNLGQYFSLWPQTCKTSLAVFCLVLLCLYFVYLEECFKVVANQLCFGACVCRQSFESGEIVLRSHITVDYLRSFVLFLQILVFHPKTSMG